MSHCNNAEVSLFVGQIKLTLRFFTNIRCRPLQTDDESNASSGGGSGGQSRRAPHNPLDAHGNDLTLTPDFEVSAAVTSHDCWEAAYRMERVKRISVEVHKQEVIDLQEVSGDSCRNIRLFYFTVAMFTILAQNITTQSTIDQLCRLLKSRVPDLSDEELAAALRPQPRSPNSNPAAEEQQFVSGVDSSPATQEFSAVQPAHTPAILVSVHLPAQTTIAAPPPPPLPLPQVQGIQIHAKYQDLFLSPPSTAASASAVSLATVSNSASMEEMTSRSDNGDCDYNEQGGSYEQTPLSAADDSGFYPEDEVGDEEGNVNIVGVSV